MSNATVLSLVKDGKIYWSRAGGSPEYQEHLVALKQLVRLGLVRRMGSGCCASGSLGFVLTQAGESALIS